MSTPSPVPLRPPRFPLWPGLLLGGLLGGSLWFAAPSLRPMVPEAWDYLLREPALVGQGVFLFLLVTLLGEGLRLRRLADQVNRMEQPGEESWPAQVWQRARISLDLRPDRRQRHEALALCRRRLERALNRRWQAYFVLALVPAVSTLVVGLRALRLDGTPLQPFFSYFQPLLLGTAEGVVLLFLAVLTREQGSRLFAAWLEKTRVFEDSRDKPAPPRREPAAEVSAPPTEQPESVRRRRSADGATPSAPVAGGNLTNMMGAQPTPQRTPPEAAPLAHGGPQLSPQPRSGEDAKLGSSEDSRVEFDREFLPPGPTFEE